MSDLGWLQNIGHSADDYPEAVQLLETVRDTVGPSVPDKDAWKLIAAVFAGLAKADMRGHISVGDEHEWATLSLMATERHCHGGKPW